MDNHTQVVWTRLRARIRSMHNQYLRTAFITEHEQWVIERTPMARQYHTKIMALLPLLSNSDDLGQFEPDDFRVTIESVKNLRAWNSTKFMNWIIEINFHQVSFHQNQVNMKELKA